MSKTKIKIIPFLIILAGLINYFYQTQQITEHELRYTGSVEGTEIKITTEVAGEIIGVRYEEGEMIEFDNILFGVDVTDYDIQLQQLKLQQEIAVLNYNQLLEGATDEEISVATQSMRSVEKQYSGAKLNYNHLKDSHEDVVVLYGSGAVSKSALDTSKLAVDQAYTTMKSIQAQVATAQASLDKVLAGAKDETIAIAKAEIYLRKLEIENLENTIAKGVKTSPTSGVIQTVNYNVGEYVMPGKTVMSIINLDTLTIDVYIRERNLHQVNIGDKVHITEGFLEGKEVMGEVVAISSKAEFTPKNVESKESKQEMVFKTRVRVTKGQEFLKPGMFVDVDIQPAVE